MAWCLLGMSVVGFCPDQGDAKLTASLRSPGETNFGAEVNFRSYFEVWYVIYTIGVIALRQDVG